MSDEQTIPMPSDTELFQQSTAPEPPAPAATPEPAASPPPPPPEQAPKQGYDTRVPDRDERGRFTGEYKTVEAPAAPAAPPQAPAADDGAPVPPPHRWKEMREERDALAARVREMEFAFYDMQQRQRAEQERLAAQQPQAKPQIPDPLIDPEGFNAYYSNLVESRARTLEQNVSFRNAHIAYGDTFEHAYGEMISRAQRGDPSIARHVMSSPDPGMAMMQWYRQAQTQARLGQHDPDTWAEKVWLEERMKDPQFRGRLLEQVRGSAQAAPNTPGGSPNVQLPPSLNRMAAAAPAITANGDMSDPSLFDHAFRQGRPPR